MAKRKRLTPAQPGYLDTAPPAPETISALPGAGRAPIAQVAGDASATAALQDLAAEMRAARESGRMIQDLPEKAIESGFLVRDRMVADEDEMRVLMDSIRARGQQTPIEVVGLENGRFGLISGWRRLTALRRLLAETGDETFATVQAILRRPDTAADAYVAMVEENEIRVGLSYYERARVAARAVEQGIYETEKKALLALFASASRAKRSKIRSFLVLYHALDHALHFAHAIPERLGLALARALEQGTVTAGDLDIALQKDSPEDAATELACLEAVLREAEDIQALNRGSETQITPEPAAKKAPAPDSATVAATDLSVSLSGRGDRRTLKLTGPAVTEALHADLLDWLRARRS